MKKTLLKESILPAFWVFFFLVSSKSETRVNGLKNDNKVPVNTGIKKQDLSESGGSNSINKNKEVTFTKAVYLSGF